MHAPLPFGLLNKGGEPTADDMSFIGNLVQRMINIQEVHGLPSVRLTRALPDGGLVVAQSAGGNLRVITDKPKPKETVTVIRTGYAHGFIPTFISGVVLNAYIHDGKIEVRLTEQCRRRLANYGNSGMIPKNAKLNRLAVLPNPVFGEFQERDSLAEVSQYQKHRHTWYSGLMASLVQLVGGYGRQTLENTDAVADSAVLNVPDKTYTEIIREMGDTILPACYGAPPADGAFLYDYKFDKTHLVAIGDGGTPWLVQISPKGVYVMPLPMIPATCTTAFREYIEGKSDSEIIEILDTFGGLPSGESFPQKADEFEAWERAGVIIRVADTRSFYRLSAFSTACGWSANMRGSEIVNTAYDYEDGSGMGRAHAFKINLSLGSVKDGGRIRPSKTEDIRNLEDRAKLAEYVSKVAAMFSGNSARDLAVRYKLRSLRPADILTKAKSTVNFNEAAEREYWENLKVRPIASASAQFSETFAGYLYSPNKRRVQPQIKFPEPYLGGCISHDFSPLEYGKQYDNEPDMDVPVFMYFIGDDLKTVKYFKDFNGFYEEEDGNFEDVMIVGSWWRRKIEGSSSLYGNFYTTDIDNRKDLPPTVEETKIVGRDLGYDHTPFFSFDAFFWKPGTIWRNRYYSHDSEIVKKHGSSYINAVCVPFFMRNAVLYAEKDSHAGTTTTKGRGLHFVRDPTSYRYWTYHPIWAWAGGLPTAKGSPYPKDGSPVWVEFSTRNTEPFGSDWADSGEWIKGLPVDYTWLVHPKADTWQHSGGGGAPKVRTYSDVQSEGRGETGQVIASVRFQADTAHKRVPAEKYFTMSPDPDSGNLFYRDGCAVSFGREEYYNVSEQAHDDSPDRAHWGRSKIIEDHTRAYCFVGVINE